MNYIIVQENGKVIKRTFLGNGEVEEEILYEDTTWKLENYFN